MMVEADVRTTCEAVSKAGHDLNNVCASILGFTTLAQDLAEPASILAQYLAEIELAAHHAIEVAQRLHDLSAKLRTNVSA